jgi:hypothetical protein
VRGLPAPLVNERQPGGVSTIVRNQPPAQRLARVDPLGDGSMRLPPLAPPDSMTESELVRKALPRDRASAVTALFEEHYASLVRMARLLVDDRETAEDVVMDAFTSLYRRWMAIRDPAEAPDTYAPAFSTAPGANCDVAGCAAATKAQARSKTWSATATRRTRPIAAR